MYKYINIKLLENILNSVFMDVKLKYFFFFLTWGELKRTLGYATAFIPLCAVKQMSC